ncbi:MAG: hypothetical protein KGD63_06905 [Candidatus Lokiarchaeota archaeon]|nr:hypothetical protein [Candidatus Lokiarchaeota archaeon]
MPSCIICHELIDQNLNLHEECPNGHQIHKNCLKKWLDRSFHCPLCNNQYNEDIISKFKLYQKEIQKEKQKELELQTQQENIEKIQKIGEKFAFLKLIESIKHLINNKDYEKALDKLNNFEDKTKVIDMHTIMFFRGKINFLREKYDLAISYLFKLVKENFNYSEAFIYLGKSYKALGLDDQAEWAFKRAKK